MNKAEDLLRNSELMKDKDIFSYLIEKELASESPHPAVAKYGEKFLSYLASVGNQLESIFLTSDCKGMEHPVVLIADKSYYLKAEKGIRILEIAKSELIGNKAVEVVRKD